MRCASVVVDKGAVDLPGLNVPALLPRVASLTHQGDVIMGPRSLLVRVHTPPTRIVSGDDSFEKSQAKQGTGGAAHRHWLVHSTDFEHGLLQLHFMGADICCRLRKIHGNTSTRILMIRLVTRDIIGHCTSLNAHSDALLCLERLCLLAVVCAPQVSSTSC